MPKQDQEADGKRDYQSILEHEIAAGVQELERPATGLTLSGLSAGLDIGFGPFLMVVVLALFAGRESEPLVRLLVANAYAVGFIFVILGRSELFTEHTALAVLPVLDGKASIRALGRLWGLVWISNLVGALFFSWFAVVVIGELEIAGISAFEEMSLPLVEPAWWVIILSGILAGWLMGLLSWLVSAGRDTISQVFFVWLVATSIGLAGLHHSIAGTVEVLMGLFAGAGVGWLSFSGFLAWTTLGNAVGGVVFLGLVKYGHASGLDRLRPGSRRS